MRDCAREKSRIVAVIPVHNRKQLTVRCLEQLRSIDLDGFDIQAVVIDDGSTDGTSEAISRNYPEVVILKGDGNLWWAGGVNKGLTYALENDFDFVYTMNDDIEIRRDTLRKLYEESKKNNSTCASISVNPETGTIVHSGYTISRFLKKLRPVLHGVAYTSIRPIRQRVDALSSMSTLVPVSVVRDIGFFDQNTFPHNYSDIDYFIRAKEHGHLLCVVQDSIIHTKGSGSNYHAFIIQKSLADIVKSFFDRKYGHHVKTLFNASMARTHHVLGFLVFCHELFPFLVWLALRAILPRNILKGILQRTGRIA